MFYFANYNFCANWRVCEVNFASRTKIHKIARWPISSSGFLHHVLYGSFTLLQGARSTVLSSLALTTTAVSLLRFYLSVLEYYVKMVYDAAVVQVIVRYELWLVIMGSNYVSTQGNQALRPRETMHWGVDHMALTFCVWILHYASHSGLYIDMYCE